MTLALRLAKAAVLVVLLVICECSDQSARAASPNAAAATQLAAPPTRQPWCPTELHPVSPFPENFWLVKTIKTGGTTLASVLRQICAHYGVVPVRKRNITPLEQMPDAAAAAALHSLVMATKNASDAVAFAVITHLNYSDAKLAAFQSAMDGRRPLLFTSVRHPLARTYSHFIQAKCANAAAMLRGKIVECDRNETYMEKLLELDNMHSRWAFVRVPSRHNLIFNYIRGSAVTAEAALAQYDFVFVSERMDEALVLFMLDYGLKLHDIAYLPSKVRTGKYKPSQEMPAELNEYVLSANHKDLQVWEEANRLLDQRRARVEQRCGVHLLEHTIKSFAALQAQVARHCKDFETWYASNHLPSQYTFVNDEGWGWRCVHHVALRHLEGGVGATAAADMGSHPEPAPDSTEQI